MRIPDELYLPPLDSRSTSFDVNREIRRTVVDLIRGDPPTTILGVLIAHSDGVTVEEIADKLDEPVGLIDWNVGKLRKEDLCVRVTLNGVKKVIPAAFYTKRNEMLPPHYSPHDHSEDERKISASRR
jgi:hypothetical protein